MLYIFYVYIRHVYIFICAVCIKFFYLFMYQGIKICSWILLSMYSATIKNNLQKCVFTEQAPIFLLLFFKENSIKLLKRLNIGYYKAEMGDCT